MNLFDSMTIKDMTLKNKIVMPPMCMNEAEDGFVNNFHIIHYATRSMGQMGLVIIEATAVLPNGRITNKDLGIWKDDHIEGLQKLVAEVKKLGAKVGIQLAHAGRKAKDATPKIAPSPIAYADYETPKAMRIDEIEQLKKAFKEGARRAFLAGFDFIEIHAAHGYLINEFLSPLANHRQDRYGGSQENRNRLLFEIIDEVRKEWPLDKPLGIRISATEHHLKGLTVKDHIKLLNQIGKEKVDVVNVSTGGVILTKVDTYAGYQLSYARQIKQNTPYVVLAGGLIESSRLAQTIVKSKEADLIYFGRLSLKDPYFPLRFAKELKEEIIWPDPYMRANI